ncbi:carbamoyltransferase C-terminal domain-containing protein [Leptospira idonii]|uniref:Carbamoyltransferase n=1 Tax=Leptospira idonii TaxID=1193500 RepID=A0A4R9LXU8_9LEPT|nr:carbamoyltransferase C-terminal domain-containing protein [Leptospira idonii]TGN18255.1 carbamoyltransferase [Leptospira idonii]
MKILGISDTHEAAAAILVDGKVIASAAEERFSRLKSDMGYPSQAIRFCLDFAGIDPKELDAVVLATNDSPAAHIRIKREATFSIKDWVDEQNLYWKKKFAGEKVSYHKLFTENPKYIHDKSYDYEGVFNDLNGVDQERFRKIRFAKAKDDLGVSEDKIHFITHEHCHSYYGYYGANIRKKALVFTCEGEGDYSNSTVSIADEKGLTEITHTKENHLAHYYRYITLILGMKPNQHEYKVMGLAPYASEYEINKVLPVFEGLLEVKDGNLVKGRQIPDSYFHFIEAFQGLRFDGIAGALQRYLEDRLSAWVLYHVKQTGIKDIVFSGGVAQNIKAMKVLKDLPEINSIFVNPISGDGSLCIGACYQYYKESNQDKNPDPLNNIYLGPSFDKQAVANSIAERRTKEKFKVIESPDVDTVAKFLAEDKIIARCAGRMEFGQRALGNRSILANPANYDNLRKINQKIKGRDFWMPFTPSLLDYRAKDYLISPFDSPFMTVAFDSTELARKHLAAAIHPADFTVRPQILTVERNANYYALIQAFEKHTGVGALLNTSFNLHGEPIVCNPSDALHTLERSELDGLLFDDFLVIRA